MFAEHSWYFRNSLVRANYENLSIGIHKTEKFLIQFLSNFLLDENHVLKNREMHIHYVDQVNDTVNEDIISLIKQNKHITANDIKERLNFSLSTVKRKIKALKEKGLIEQIGSDKTGYWKIIGK